MQYLKSAYLSFSILIIPIFPMCLLAIIKHRVNVIITLTRSKTFQGGGGIGLFDTLQSFTITFHYSLAQQLWTLPLNFVLVGSLS